MYIYNFADFCSMIADENRMNGFHKALEQAVKPDSVVLDIGAGTGIFSLLACKFGARKVYAVEPNLVVHIAREAALANGFADRIEFIEDFSTKIDLPEKADVLICDLRGNLPFFEYGPASIIDARKRLLKPGATMIPRRDTVYFAVAESEETYHVNIENLSQDFYGIKAPSSRRLLTNRIINTRGKKQEIISQAEVFAVLDYQTLDQEEFSASFRFEVSRDGMAHGLRGWFRGELGNEAFVTNAPDSPEIIYGAPFFPFEHPLSAKKGDIIAVDINTKFENGDYIWGWNTKLISASGEEKAAFQNSTLASTIIAPSSILKQSEYFQPKPSEEAMIDAFAISQMDGEKMNGDIADALLEKFPEKFKDFEAALARVAEATQKYCS